MSLHFDDLFVFSFLVNFALSLLVVDLSNFLRAENRGAIINFMGFHETFDGVSDTLVNMRAVIKRRVGVPEVILAIVDFASD